MHAKCITQAAVFNSMSIIKNTFVLQIRTMMDRICEPCVYYVCIKTYVAQVCRANHLLRFRCRRKHTEFSGICRMQRENEWTGERWRHSITENKCNFHSRCHIYLSFKAPAGFVVVYASIWFEWLQSLYLFNNWLSMKLIPETNMEFFGFDNTEYKALKLRDQL